MAVQEPSQSALHFVVQSAVVETETHWVEQWSPQHAVHEDSQSVDDVAVEPSGPDDELEEDVHDALHPDSHRELQSVVQSNFGGLVAHEVPHDVVQLEVQSVLAVASHCALHCCSSFAAQACSQLAGVHCVVQLLCVTSVQLALASTSMSPQAETLAEAVCGQANRGRSRPRAVDARSARRCGWVLMTGTDCNR